MYQNFVGIDIAKASFVAASHQQQTVKQYTNDPDGFKQFHKEYRDLLKNGLVILETTGGYEMSLIRFLQKHQYAVHRANTIKVKYFIRSLGKLGKSDNIDALGLAAYGFERQAKLNLFAENPGKKLQKLVYRRNQLKQMLVQEKNRLKSPELDGLEKSYRLLITALEKEIERIQLQIDDICSNDPDLNAKKNVLKTVNGIGDIIATQLLALLPEIGQLNRKQIASLAGVAPHPNESGGKVGYRYTKGGRSEVKRVLFMAAMSASRSQSQLGKFYERLVGAGKKKMVALTALMRKIVVIANARMKEFLAIDGVLTT